MCRVSGSCPPIQARMTAPHCCRLSISSGPDVIHLTFGSISLNDAGSCDRCRFRRPAGAIGDSGSASGPARRLLCTAVVRPSPMRPSAMAASRRLGATRDNKLAGNSACAWLQRSYWMWSKSFDGRRNVEPLLSRLNMVVPTNMSSSSQRMGDVIRRCRGDRGRRLRPRYIELPAAIQTIQM
jgi:hypothetical protein